MAANSAQEQLMLELVNRARMNPAGEAAKFGINLNQGLAPGTISTAPKQVLAMHDKLVISSDRHSNWMLVNDKFDHLEIAATPGFTGVTPGNRMTAAGYVFSGPVISNGENISWRGSTGAINATATIISQHQDLFLSPGHRTNILDDTFKEVGIGQVAPGQFTYLGTTYNASMVTQNFALSGTRTFITGVVYNDTVVNDDFFTVGEQAAGRAVSSPGAPTDTTGAGGGYELGFTTAGAKTVSFNLSTGTLSVSVVLNGKNLKIDAVNGHEIWTNADLKAVAGPITELHALGIQGIDLTGIGANEKLFGNAAPNILNGAGGNDTIGGGGGADVIIGGAGSDILTGGAGIDTLTGGASNDFVVFNAPLSAANRDVVTDFGNVAGNNDAFRLENAVMAGLGAATGALNATLFFAGAAAHDANDRIVYNKATGVLNYDSNGNVSGGITQLATLSTKPVLTAADFIVI
jgi:Ca2+-binding RTX toxin-like protein